MMFYFLQGSRGDLLVSLCYNPTANTITVSIIKARNLKAMDIGGTSGINASLSVILIYACTSSESLLPNGNIFFLLFCLEKGTKYDSSETLGRHCKRGMFSVS